MTTTAVLLMAYGSPRTLDDVGPYLQDIRGGREPSREAVAELTERYSKIGGDSPLLQITRRQAGMLQMALNVSDAGRYTVRIGMKHWHPYIAETVARIDSQTVIGLVLAPHYSKMSIGGYEDRLRAARDESQRDFEIRMVHSWYDEPLFVTFAADNLRKALGDQASQARVFFTAHSLPERILAEGDPYVDQLQASAKLIAEQAGAGDYELAFQSASPTGVPWLGPDILDRLESFAGDGGRSAVIAPIGFTADHLEILYDIDVECMQKAAELGIELRRTASPNDDERFIDALAAVVRQAAR